MQRIAAAKPDGIEKTIEKAAARTRDPQVQQLLRDALEQHRTHGRLLHSAPGALVQIRTHPDAKAQSRREERLRHLRSENEAMRASLRSRSQDMADLGQELRAPLISILGFSWSVARGATGELNPKQQEFLDDIVRAGEHLLRLIDDVLDVARLDAGTLEFRPAQTDLMQVADNVERGLRQLAQERQVQVRVEVHPEAKQVFLDPKRLHQVLHHFLTNALRCTGPGGHAVVRAVPHEDACVRIEVEDTGPGIRREDLPRLFRLFEQLHGTDRLQGGTGLGLALVKRVVEAQGGSVGVRSRWRRGSTFHAVLPRSVQESPPVLHAA